MEKTAYSLKIVTPEGTHSTIENVAHTSLPGKVGEIGIYPDHSPALYELNPGQVLVKKENGSNAVLFIPSGILHINEDDVSVLVPFVETADQIDKQRAEEAKTRAKNRIDSPKDVDLDRAQQALLRAQERLFILEQKQKPSNKK